MKLSELVRGLDVQVIGDDVEIDRVTIDSRLASRGALFVACRGATPRSRDGHDFVDNALASGASAVAVSRDADAWSGRSTVVVVRDARRLAAVLAERIAGEPSHSLDVVGVTGTNGKTTVTFLVAQAMKALGRHAAVLGTLGVGDPDAPRAFGYTTPEAEVLSVELRRLVDVGTRVVAMEVSSHALATARVDGVRFRVAAFTNLTQDHLDFHGTMAEYLRAKERLFTELLDDAAVAVLPSAPVVVEGASLGRGRGRTITWGLSVGDVHASDIAHTASGIALTLHREGLSCRLESPLVGAHNVENLLVAAGILSALGVTLDDIGHGLAAARGAPGRLERVVGPPGAPMVVVDYAHTPDALARVIDAVRAGARARVIVVFGCGGDRDRAKRPLMGREAAARADVVVLTSDNPRSERPDAILDDIEPGVRVSGMPPLSRNKRGWLRVADRREAIRTAVALADPDDVVLIAGKGHETTMTVGDVVTPFDDRVVAAQCLAEVRL